MPLDLETFLKTASLNQKELLREIRELGMLEGLYAGNIEKINHSVKFGIYSPDGASASLCEDADDAAVISAGPKKSLEDVQAKLKDCMIKSLELGMRELDIIQKNYERYVGKPMPQKP